MPGSRGKGRGRGRKAYGGLQHVDGPLLAPEHLVEPQHGSDRRLTKLPVCVFAVCSFGEGA